MLKKKNAWEFINKHQQWIGFVLIIAAMLYAFITVLLEPKHILLDVVYSIFFAFLLYGLIHAYTYEKENIKRITFKSLDSIFVIIGVFATYGVVHFFSVSVVVVSSAVGLIGHFLAKKYEASIYCGSFAGMVSVALFGFFEVLVLAIVCAVIYILTKPLFKGYGGKLGTVAFMSSLIVHSIFADEFLSANFDSNFGLLMSATILGVLLTFYLQHMFNTSAVLASSTTSFVVSLILFLIFPAYEPYAVIFFSASFIGMSSKNHMPKLVFVILAGVILGLIYFIFIEFFNGLGGKLGLMAFISVIIVSGVSKFFKVSKPISKH